jgi:hypothetical protein
VGRGWLPSNSWLASELPVNVNVNSTCNAFWNGFSLNFYRSGSGCGNTGEIAAVSLHEYGHGLDSNDGSGFSSDGGTGEAYADVTAALMLRDSCIGPGFRATNCGGYGDACGPPRPRSAYPLLRRRPPPPRSPARRSPSTATASSPAQTGRWSLSTRRPWCRGTLGAMTQVQVSLAPWQGKMVRVRWRAGEDDSDDSDASPGWYLDSFIFHDVVVDDGCTLAPPPADFYSLTPCRLLDTRTANAPALQPGQVRTFQIAGSYGVPATATAVSVNVTAVSPGAVGSMILFRTDQAPPLATSIGFRAGETRSNNGVISISPLGEVSVQPSTTAPLHLALDVNGYFQ